MLREPVQLMFSWYNYLFARGHETLGTMTDALEAEHLRISEFKNISSMCSYPSSLDYTRVVQFDKNISRYYDLFDHKNIKVVLFDDLKKDVQGVYKDILKFLEVDSDFVCDFEVRNKGKSVKNVSTKRLVDKYSKSLKRSLLPYRENEMLKRLHSFYTSMFFDNKSYLESEEYDTIRNQRKENLTEMLKRTSDLIDRDLLGLWKY
jgi:hypothetical protein